MWFIKNQRSKNSQKYHLIEKHNIKKLNKILVNQGITFKLKERAHLILWLDKDTLIRKKV